MPPAVVLPPPILLASHKIVHIYLRPVCCPPLQYMTACSVIVPCEQRQSFSSTHTCNMLNEEELLLKRCCWRSRHGHTVPNDCPCLQTAGWGFIWCMRYSSTWQRPRPLFPTVHIDLGFGIHHAPPPQASLQLQAAAGTNMKWMTTPGRMAAKLTAAATGHCNRSLNSWG